MPTLAKSFSRVTLFVSCLLVLVTVAGCSSTKVLEQQAYEGEKRPRPDRIIIYDFAATPVDLPPWSEVASRYAEPSTPRSVEEIDSVDRRSPRAQTMTCDSVLCSIAIQS
jgi:hypothetical protein